MRRRMAELRYSPRSVTTYVSWIKRYVVFNDRRHPRDLGPDDVRRFLSRLARQEHVAASTQNQALAALTFLYDRVLGHPRWSASTASSPRGGVVMCRSCSRSMKFARSSHSWMIQRGSAFR